MMDDGRYGRDLTEETFHEFLERKDRGEEVDGVVRISGVGFCEMREGKPSNPADNSDHDEGIKNMIRALLDEQEQDRSKVKDLTVAQLWDCVEALMVLVDVRANKDLYKAGGDYKERKREAWGMAEEVLKKVGLMEVPE